MIVASDGSGDFLTIQEAIDQVPEDNTERVIIRIKNGIYKEKLHVEKSRLHIIGEDAQKTVITYDDFARKQFPNGEPYNTFHSYSVFIGADNIVIENVTFENSAGRGEVVGQALAAYINGDKQSFKNCRFIGHQDTLFTGPLPEKPLKRATFGGPCDNENDKRLTRQYYENCYIEGDVDFIFGSATAVFERCEIYSKNRLTEENTSQIKQHQGINGWITAASTPKVAAFGYVFMNCKLTSDGPPETVYLGRPWRNDAKVAFLNCWMGEHIRPEGWHNWNKLESEETTSYCEFNSTGPGGDTQDRVKWSTILTAEEAAAYTIENIFKGRDDWNPKNL